MDVRPVTGYARSLDGVNIAYHVIGDGKIDLTFVPGGPYPIDLLREEPGFIRFAKRLGGFSRTLWYERRGLGASGGDFLDNFADGISEADLTAVLDAAQSGPIVLVGSGHVGTFVIRYAAIHPERVMALILIDTYAHYVREDGYPWGLSPDALDRFGVAVLETWGTGTVKVIAPSKSDDERFRAWLARCERLGFSPDVVSKAFRLSLGLDVRALLPTLRVPTLVLHREGGRSIKVGAGRYLAEHIPGAKYVELSGEDQLFFVGDTDVLLDEIEEFLTGSHQGAEGDVVTSTILFTDIVSSTEQSARMGHRKWSALTDAHDAMVRSALKNNRGHEVKTIGDGFLATFDATTRAVRAGMEIVAGAKGLGLDVRAGIHTGDVEVRGNDIAGLSVTIARRICDLADAGQLLVSEGVKGQLVGSGVATSEQGTHVLKGVPDEWRLFVVGV